MRIALHGWDYSGLRFHDLSMSVANKLRRPPAKGLTKPLIVVLPCTLLVDVTQASKSKYKYYSCVSLGLLSTQAKLHD